MYSAAPADWDRFLEKSIDSFTDSMFRIIEGVRAKNAIDIRRFILGILFYTQRKDRSNTSGISSPQRNSYHFNGA